MLNSVYEVLVRGRISLGKYSGQWCVSVDLAKVPGQKSPWLGFGHDDACLGGEMRPVSRDGATPNKPFDGFVKCTYLKPFDENSAVLRFPDGRELAVPLGSIVDVE